MRIHPPQEKVQRHRQRSGVRRGRHDDKDVPRNPRTIVRAIEDLVISALDFDDNPRLLGELETENASGRRTDSAVIEISHKKEPAFRYTRKAGNANIDALDGASANQNVRRT